jgi:transcriptional regulator with XRE-family HTH domain
MVKTGSKFLKEFGMNLKQIRQSKGLTQRGLLLYAVSITAIFPRWNGERSTLPY